MVVRIASLLLFIFLASSSFSQSTTGPNIIVILADDLGYGDLGAFGSKVIKTPHLDQMSEEGLRLTRFYSGSTVCAPSRTSLMTGKHTGHSYIRGNGEIPLREKDVILPQLLKQEGYQTAMFGKWGLGDINTSGMPHLKGWDTFYGFLHHVEAHFQFPAIVWKSTPEEPLPQRIGIPGFNGFACDFFMNEAFEWLDHRDKSKPFFTYLSLPIPHAELVLPKNYMKDYLNEDGDSKFQETPYDGSHYGGQPQPKAAYASMVSRLDDYVGQVFKYLKENNLDKNTLVLFTSDNGTHKEGGRTLDDVAIMQSSGLNRGIKRDLYEGGIKVPTLVWGAGMPANEQRDNPGAFWDLLPTFLEMAGSKYMQNEFDGVSQLAYWKNNTKVQERPFYWEFLEGGFSQAVLWKNKKYIFYLDKNGESREELFDLQTDPMETANLAASMPGLLNEMRRIKEVSHKPAEHPAFLSPLDTGQKP